MPARAGAYRDRCSCWPPSLETRWGGGTISDGWWVYFFSSRRRHTRCSRDWSSDVCSSDLNGRPNTASSRAGQVCRPAICTTARSARQPTCRRGRRVRSLPVSHQTHSPAYSREDSSSSREAETRTHKSSHRARGKTLDEVRLGNSYGSEERVWEATRKGHAGRHRRDYQARCSKGCFAINGEV